MGKVSPGGLVFKILLFLQEKSEWTLGSEIDMEMLVVLLG